MKSRIVLIIALLLLVFGCASNEKKTWVPAGPAVSDQQFSRDNYECMQGCQSSWSGGGTGSDGIAMILISKSRAQDNARMLYEECMKSKGYTLRLGD